MMCFVAVLQKDHTLKLTDLRVNQRAKITQFQPGANAYRQRLLAMGLIPGTTLTVKRIAPLGDPMELSVRGYALSLRKKETQLIDVELLENEQ